MVEPSRDWQEVLASVEQDLGAWQAAHPAATLTEMEQAVDQRLREARTRILGDLTGAVQPTATCPRCGDPLVRRGVHTRSLTTPGDQPLSLTRPYATCPACGTGLFPP
jgi:ribosomal protein S27AE